MAAKRRAICLGLFLLAVWPGIQFVLANTYELSPWRFFGWAMYCVPKLPVNVQMYSLGEGVREPIEPRDPEIRRAAADFRHRREIWGTLLRPDSLGRLLTESTEPGRTIEIAVEHLVLRREDARIAARTHRYTYARSPDQLDRSGFGHLDRGE